MKSKSAVLSDCGLEFDFRNAYWGMTKSEVKYSEIASPNSEGESYITYRENVMDMDAIVGFHFLNGSLVEAGYAFREQEGDECRYLREYDKVKHHLTRVYGEPRFDENMSEGVSLCGEACGHDAAASADTLLFLSEWLTGRSIIRLILMGEGGTYDFGLLHRSREHVPLIEIMSKMREAC